MISDRTGTSGSRRSRTNPVGVGTSIFFMLVLTAPAMLCAENPSTNSTDSSQASSLQKTGGQAGQTPNTAPAPVPKEVVGTPYDKSKITALPGSPEVNSNRGTTAESKAPAPVELISPVPHSGNPGTYKIILAKTGPYEGELALDLGFSNYARLADVVKDTTPFREGEVVAFQEKEGEVREALGANPESQLYTYRAWVNRVLDGDTIEVVIDLGFGFTTTQTLKFRAIDAPEIFYKDSATKKADPSLSQTTTQVGAGMEAKEFVEKALAGASPVFIKTTHSDKYDRYLVDVFITDKNGEEQYLNNLLLEEGLAVRVRE